MEMRTFEGVTLQDAIKSVKRAFGSEAVILATKERKMEGGKGRMFEVTAAAPSSYQKGPGAVAKPGAQMAANTEMVAGLVASLDRKLNHIQDSLPSVDQVGRLETGLHELKMILLESIKSTKGSPIKNLPAHMEAIHTQLQIMGVDPVYCVEMMKYLRSLPEPTINETESVEDHYRNQAMRWMLKRIKIAPQWSVVQGCTSIHAVVGTTGSGKSSAVAKLAAYYQKRKNYSVKLISFDNKRLAATEQLRVYSKIIGSQFAVIDDAAELEAAIVDADGCDIILIDTAGVNPKSDDGLGDLEALTQVDVPIDIHLCLPITEKESQLDRSVKTFNELGIQSLIFTKLDESWNFGEIFNVSHRWSLPLSFFSTGQKIPEDMERASRERVIERIFGL